MKLGDKQIGLLIFAASPASLLLTPDRLSASLVARGLMAEDKGGACRITAAGLRALADAMESGQVARTIAAAKAKRRAAHPPRGKQG